jgi:hypothetical protein
MYTSMVCTNKDTWRLCRGTIPPISVLLVEKWISDRKEDNMSALALLNGITGCIFALIVIVFSGYAVVATFKKKEDAHHDQPTANH